MIAGFSTKGACPASSMISRSSKLFKSTLNGSDIVSHRMKRKLNSYNLVSCVP